MVAYSFRPRFVEPIRAGTKIQTIRDTGRRRHATRGDALQLYTGMRTKHCRLIARATCTQSCAIEIVRGDRIEDNRVEFGERWIDCTGLDAFARADGFADWGDLEDFWDAERRPRHWRGVIIFWNQVYVAGDTIGA